MFHEDIPPRRRPSLTDAAGAVRFRLAPLGVAILAAMAACAPVSSPTALPTLAVLAPTPVPATPAPPATITAPPTALPRATVPATEPPTRQPTSPPTRQPASQPVNQPTAPPDHQPTSLPAIQPTIPSPPSSLCGESGQILTMTYPSVVDGPQRDYRVYLPPCYGADGRVYPVLVLLHGLGVDQDEFTWDNLGVDEAMERGIAAGDWAPFLVVMPAGGWAAQFTSGGPGSFESIVVDALLPHVAGHFCAWDDPEGWAIGGLSRGGYWALEIAFRHPERFASVGGHSAALLDIGAGPDLNPQYTALSRDLGPLRIYLDVGDEDYGMLPNVTRLHEDMESAGIPHDWRLNAGGHTSAYWTEHVPDYLAWYAAAWPSARAVYPLCPASARQ